ncbi:hypothetical protein GALMADRAFT_57781 [Galerina marginata CBS 339.88]|uniref:SGF29 C-terminal domain-containing protein n=1 Tax=Galerina marginata (strain CBS 339.88) TaxID=685588 RepID=A0A067TV31_GALM3|nr:hypothetical protein GALMADRAFT_57781 [Galerina marginata CBS 339.88]
MDSRRRAMPTRPTSNEEIQCWGHASQSLKYLSNIHAKSNTAETISRVNRLISTWPTDDALPAEGLGGLKTTQSKLAAGLAEITAAAEQETKAIDHAIERVSVLMALRNAPEAALPSEKRKRPRASSPTGTPIPNPSGSSNTRSVSITLPPRTNSVGPSSSTRDSRTKKDVDGKQHTLQKGRKVVFRPPKSTDTEEGTWIVAKITDRLAGGKYEVQDVEPQDDGQPGIVYTATIRQIMPLPDPDASPGSPAHFSLHPTFAERSVVLALYPDTSCFYRAEVISAPQKSGAAPQSSTPSTKIPTYQVKFEDDDDMIHNVSAYMVVQFPLHLL